jgi:hypothetical protein
MVGERCFRGVNILKKLVFRNRQLVFSKIPEITFEDMIISESKPSGTVSLSLPKGFSILMYDLGPRAKLRGSLTAFRNKSFPLERCIIMLGDIRSEGTINVRPLPQARGYGFARGYDFAPDTMSSGKHLRSETQ